MEHAIMLSVSRHIVYFSSCCVLLVMLFMYFLPQLSTCPLGTCTHTRHYTCMHTQHTHAQTHPHSLTHTHTPTCTLTHPPSPHPPTWWSLRSNLPIAGRTRWSWPAWLTAAAFIAIRWIWSVTLIDVYTICWRKKLKGWHNSLKYRYSRSWNNKVRN